MIVIESHFCNGFLNTNPEDGKYGLGWRRIENRIAMIMMITSLNEFPTPVGVITVIKKLC